ncbi:MAG: SAM-dependent methyltransferase [Egibacteraceae bacterium]
MTKGDRVGRSYFEAVYSSKRDPFGFETSPYEAAKYARSLAALGDRRFARALEVGCSIGVFTAMLAPHCVELVAVDISTLAVARARERLAGVPGVRVERRTLPEQMPQGPFDLIVCAKVLCYWGREVLTDGIERFRAALAPGGSFLAVHCRPHDGDKVHATLSSDLGFPCVVSAVEPLYRLDRFDCPP